ncbi:MAG: UPF0280 family protein [Candidatus Omnitrophota bacterium]|jgi:hypothetical protein
MKYRDLVRSPDLVKFEVIKKESDLLISAENNLKQRAGRLLAFYRNQIEDYARKNPSFGTSFAPVKISARAPKIVKYMAEAGRRAGVGPMAAVAGAIAEFVGRDLSKFSEEIIVENGGDIFLKTARERLIGIYAGKSKSRQRLAIRISPQGKSRHYGICTSSGTVGHSFSFGRADAVVVISGSAVLADAFATSIANIIKSPPDIAKGLGLAKKHKDVIGVIIIAQDKIGISKGLNSEVKSLSRNFLGNRII